MKLELTSTKINKVMGRKELHFKIQEPITPSRLDVKREIAVLMRTNPENVFVRMLETKTGDRLITGLAHVYNDANTGLKVEPKHIITRNMGKKAEKSEENHPEIATEAEEKKK